MRFRLVDDEVRQFVAERFCSRGAIDDWIDISDSESLQTLVKKYVPTLGTDKFYELY